MGKGKELMEFQKGAILYGHRLSHSCRKIAETVECGSSAVSTCIRRYKATGFTDI
ncbi:15473_t:CDS:1, partial [Funneliformis geosporum]